MADDRVELDFMFVHQTEAAFKLNNGDEDMWVPKSVASPTSKRPDQLREGDLVTFEVAEWFAEREGLV